MRRLGLAVTLTWLAAFQSGPAQPASPAQQTGAATLQELRQQLAAQLADSRFAAAVFGVKVVSLDTGKTLFEHDAAKLLSPASNCKLFTMALALDRLGGNYRIQTSLYASARPTRSGTLKGDLIIYGRGDPSFNARRHGGDIFAALDRLVTALTNAGVRRIQGDVIGDDSFFQGPPYGSGWSWDDMQYYYGAEISALSINDNALELSVSPGPHVGAPCRLSLKPDTRYLLLSNRTTTVAHGLKRVLHLYRPIEHNVLYVTGQMPLDDKPFTETVTVHQPAGLFAEWFREALLRRGVRVRGRARAVGWLERQTRPLDTARLVELATVESPPLRELVREVQKPSQNLYTDLILAHIGERERARRATAGAADAAPSFRTSEELGVDALETFLARVGIARNEARFEEGSGLSRNNLATPNAIIQLLQFMDRHAEAEAWRDALPIAGVDGTLRNRMKDTPAAGNVRAKTGTLRWANALSGYLTSAAGERLAFALVLNRYVPPDAERTARAEIDKITVALAAFRGRSDEGSAGR
ncbi:MAG: D-alanyl-D-alanine carboxypeptidase/D-alanyl-D-alanine-endopeptidase [Verrucomicrobiae bacterium]|nr:D-alanyl-D-alanine carboxypeptidase/D-alanyl-D-alanine-endopeptidase [Verrucomicrobiae bacterium]MDW8309998.1 D-alanyl-D-alanine carboxypeptidase/D-alanyl-D-alanine-endopeptidase [Verrucomicrobiales bacterium]